jgi:hypothetical protein
MPDRARRRAIWLTATIIIATDTRPPATAPLLFTALGIAGIGVLRYGTKGN